jgi:hypothetical protein
MGVALLGALTYLRLWGRLWLEWFTSIDHKPIGIMYMVLGRVMLLRGFSDAVMMRLQQAVAVGGAMPRNTWAWCLPAWRRVARARGCPHCAAARACLTVAFTS